MLSSRPVKRAKKGRKSTRRYLSTYYDTRQHLLRKAGCSLRVREVNGKFEQTIKIPIEGSAGMLTSQEWTLPISTAQPDLSLFDETVIDGFNPRRRKIRLLPMFTTDVERSRMLLEYRRARIELALDRGRIVTHRKSARSVELCELELELLRGSQLAMLDFALTLNESCELYSEHRSKAQRGYALLRSSLKPKAVKAEHVPLDARMSAGQAFHRIIASALRQLYHNEVPTLEGSPGGVHQARVSIRRIRAALRAFKKVLPYDKRKAFNGEFRWFQLRLAPARDWHVFLSETLPKIESFQPYATDNLDKLHKLAARERRRATRDAKELFRSRRYTRLLLQFQRWLMTLDAKQSPLDTDVSEFATTVLKKCRRDFLLDTRPLSRMTMEELHDLRKRGKKARYATEFFSDLWTEAEIKSTVRAMEKIQDMLGKVNDASVARQVLAGVSPRALQALTLLLVQNWSDARSRECIRAAQPVWRKFVRERPPWLDQ